MIEFLALPALACVALVGIHAYFGLQVLKRNVIFVDLALAQVAALGATVAFTLGHLPQSPASYAYSLSFTLLTAVILASTRAWSTRIPQEAQIGIIYVVAAAAALLLVDRAPQGAEHIRQILTGNILTVGWSEVAWAAGLYAVVGLLHPRLRLTGWLSDFAFYAAFGLVVTSSVALAGVLIFAVAVLGTYSAYSSSGMRDAGASDINIAGLVAAQSDVSGYGVPRFAYLQYSWDYIRDASPFWLLGTGPATGGSGSASLMDDAGSSQFQTGFRLISLGRGAETGSVHYFVNMPQVMATVVE